MSVLHGGTRVVDGSEHPEPDTTTGNDNPPDSARQASGGPPRNEVTPDGFFEADQTSITMPPRSADVLRLPDQGQPQSGTGTGGSRGESPRGRRSKPFPRTAGGFRCSFPTRAAP